VRGTSYDLLSQRVARAFSFGPHAEGGRPESKSREKACGLNVTARVLLACGSLYITLISPWHHHSLSLPTQSSHRSSSLSLQVAVDAVSPAELRLLLSAPLPLVKSVLTVRPVRSS